MTYKDIIPNPYDEKSTDLTPETLPLDEIIRRAISNATIKLRVHLPAKITAVKGNQKVDVQPLLKTRYTDGTVVDMPVIQNVMVQMPLGEDYSLKFPIAVGDNGNLVFCDRSLDVFSAGDGQAVDPKDSRTHDISDPIFIPGLPTFAKQTKDATSDLVLKNGLSTQRWKKDGGISFNGGVMEVKFNPDGTFIFTNGVEELMDLLVQITGKTSDIANTLANDTVNTIFGASKLNSFATYAQLKLDLDDLKDRLETLKG